MSPARRVDPLLFEQLIALGASGDGSFHLSTVAATEAQAEATFAAAQASLADKVAHVRQAGQDRSHTCHWPGCEVQVPPAMWGCKRHWFRLPKRLRDMIWEVYVPGQEARMDPSEEYLAVARHVQEWIEANGVGA